MPIIRGIHHIEIYVANHIQAAFYYGSTLGLQVAGQATFADRVSTVLTRDSIRFVVTAPLGSSSRVAEHLRIHGEGIKDIAFSVSGVPELFERAVKRGATPVLEPCQEETAQGRIQMARLGAVGDLVHTLIADDAGGGQVLPGFTVISREDAAGDTALTGIDHIALALGSGDLERCVEFYIAALGFEKTHQEAVSTEYSGMSSTVVQSPNGAVRFPMMEPAVGRRKSQIQTYIDAHEGAGAQHVALLSTDIVKSATVMAGRGIEFMNTPGAYYEDLENRLGPIQMDLTALRRLGILADREGDGILLQVFTKPVGTRPTLFLELVERRGAHGFGSGNIRALFEAVERAQALGGAA